MKKIAAGSSSRRAAQRSAPRAAGSVRRQASEPADDESVSLHGPKQARFEAIMEAAERSGLLDAKSTRIGTRISPALLRQAKEHTGIEANSDLIAFALASVALEDDFVEAFKRTRGTVDPDLKLGF